MMRRSNHGFTLVELAIVMVIIGLLIGGVLKGQELIANAKASSTAAQLKSVDAALNTFMDKYNALPGDMNSPATRLPNCTAAPCATSSVSNMRIDNAGSAMNAPTIASESGRVFVQLSAANLITGINQDFSVMSFGGNLPTIKAGGGMWIGYHPVGVLDTTLLPAARHYAVLSDSVANVALDSGAISVNIIAQIDRKIDDGMPLTGSMQVGGDNSRTRNCKNGTVPATIYRESTEGGNCPIYIRVLN